MECYNTINNVPEGSNGFGGTSTRMIFPGTKWCGEGDIADNDDDLGYLRELDKCCRAHDKCPQFILKGETNYNLTNTDIFTSLHCDCDLEFYYCLKDSKSLGSPIVGNMYFNRPNGKCFKEDYPIIRCLSSKVVWWFYAKCLVYEMDESREKLYQFFDLPYFE